MQDQNPEKVTRVGFDPVDQEPNFRIKGLTAALSIAGALAVAALLVGLGLAIEPRQAAAIPAFARQTGQPCSACHTAFPELTPFGRSFKLGGYTLGGGKDNTLPDHLAIMLLPTFTHTQKNQDAPPAPGTFTNNNLVLQQASIFYGGKIYGNLGAFVQGTYDRASGHVFLDNTDIRYADTTKLFGHDFLYGFTFNNTPTVQDVWNTTTAWGFPEVGPTLAPQFSPPGTMIEGAFAGQVAGAGAYTYWNDMLYIELTGYHTVSKTTLSLLGEPDIASSDGINGLAPYWRIALEPNWGDNSLEVGAFGMAAQIFPMRVSAFGANQVTDIGLDSQYQYNGDKNSFTLKLTDIFERQKLDSSFVQGNSSNRDNSLRSFKISGSWVYNHTYSLSAGLFDVAGTADAGLYAGGALAGSPMGEGQPNGRGLLFDAAYLPFSNGGPAIWPWANARIGVSYTRYLTLYGGSTNFDGLGHNAKDNNTVFLYSWIAF